MPTEAGFIRSDPLALRRRVEFLAQLAAAEQALGVALAEIGEIARAGEDVAGLGGAVDARGAQAGQFFRRAVVGQAVITLVRREVYLREGAAFRLAVAALMLRIEGAQGGIGRRIEALQVLLQELVFLHQAAADDLIVAIKAQRQTFAIFDLLADIVVDQGLQLGLGRVLAELLAVGFRQAVDAVGGDSDAVARGIVLDRLAGGEDQAAQQEEMHQRFAGGAGKPGQGRRDGGRVGFAGPGRRGGCCGRGRCEGDGHEGVPYPPNL